MTWPIQQARENPQCHQERVLLLLLDGVQLQLLFPVEISLGERRIENHVGKKFERCVQLGFQRREPNEGEI